MPVFKEKNGKLIKLGNSPVKLEKQLQKLVEKNLSSVLDMTFLDTEYPTIDGRIDTLAIDSTGAPVIIEYKKNKNSNIISQAISYLRWLKDQKEEFFERLLQKKLGTNIAKKTKINWKNPRVICIAESYSKQDINMLKVMNTRIELLKYKCFEDGIFIIEPAEASGKWRELSKSKKNINKTQITADINVLVNKGTDKIRKIFSEIQKKIMDIDPNIIEKITAVYVAYRLTKNFACIYIDKNQLRVLMRSRKYHDPKNLIKKIPAGYNWVLDRCLYLTELEQIPYAIERIEESYKDVL